MKKIGRNGITILFIIMLFVSACSKDEENKGLPPGALGPLESVTCSLGGVEVEIEIAYTPQEQQQGLMYRKSMPENHGMLFVNQAPRYLTFWMKNTHIPLAIAFIREDKVISNIEEMKPQVGSIEPSERYYSRYQCQYALEMNAGWFQKHGLKAGDALHLPWDEIERIITHKQSTNKT